MENKEYILELIDINKSFFGVKVLKDVNFKLRRGKILGLCGENGAGKSTLMNIISGIYQRDSGKMILDGQEYAPKSPKDSQKAGIAFIHQELNLFLNLTVKQNFVIENPPRKGGLIDDAKVKATANAAIEKLGEKIDINTVVENLPIGQRQLVEIAKETAKDSRIIIFDEPTTSLSNKEKERLFKIIENLKADGMSIIFISHILEDVLEICDDIVVLRDGSTIIADDCANFTREKLIKNMVGREMNTLYPYVEKTPGEELVRYENITQEGVVKDVSFSIKKGEIVGMFGLMGAGRSEFARTVFGLDPMSKGKVYIDGKEITKVDPITMKDAGVSFVTENRRDEGLMLSKSIKENIVLASLSSMTKKNGLMDGKKEEDVSKEQAEHFNIKTYDVNRQTAGQFSGGNQQKIVFAKWLLAEPRVFMLDEPTKGVDVGAKYDIYTYINDLALGGGAVLFISSEMGELIGVCDRILVMANGKLSGELKRGEYTQEKLLELALGGEVNE